MGTTARPRSRRGEGDRLRDEILLAAEELLLATGSEDAVSIRAVASRVGVSAPAIYRHFADKNALMFEVCDAQFRRLDEHLEAKRSDHADPVEAIRACGRAYVEFGLAHPEHYRIMFMSRTDLTTEQYTEEILGQTSSFTGLVEAVEDCCAAGRCDGDAFETAVGLWVMVHGLTSLLIAKPNFPWPDDLVERTLDTVAARYFLTPA